MPAVGSLAVAYAFGHIVAADNRREQIFIFVITSFGLFIVISGLADQLRRKHRKR